MIIIIKIIIITFHFPLWPPYLLSSPTPTSSWESICDKYTLTGIWLHVSNIVYSLKSYVIMIFYSPCQLSQNAYICCNQLADDCLETENFSVSHQSKQAFWWDMRQFYSLLFTIYKSDIIHMQRSKGFDSYIEFCFTKL